MCFSAAASFTAGAVLTGIGIASLKEAKERSEIPFACVPLIFALQQFTEGAFWLSAAGPGRVALRTPATYTFLFIAQVIWPCWVPFSVYEIEPDKARKKILAFTVGIGLMVSAYLLFCLVRYNVEGSVVKHHVLYRQDYPGTWSRVNGLLYILSTVAPPLLASVRRMLYLGMCILASYIVSAIFYEEYLVSVWCFFAAVISIFVLAVVRGTRQSILTPN